LAPGWPDGVNGPFVDRHLVAGWGEQCCCRSQALLSSASCNCCCVGLKGTATAVAVVWFEDDTFREGRGGVTSRGMSSRCMMYRPATFTLIPWGDFMWFGVVSGRRPDGQQLLPCLSGRAGGGELPGILSVQQLCTAAGGWQMLICGERALLLRAIGPGCGGWGNSWPPTCAYWCMMAHLQWNQQVGMQ